MRQHPSRSTACGRRRRRPATGSPPACPPARRPGAPAVGADDDGPPAARRPHRRTPTGTDDGTKLTLWTRAPLEKQAKLLVDGVQRQPQEPGRAHRRARTTTTSPRSAPRPAPSGLPDLFAADIVYVPNWVKQGLFQDLTTQIDGLAFKDSINKGHLDGRHLRRQGVRAAVRPRPVDAVLEQGPVQGGRARPGEGAGRRSRSSPQDAKAVQALNKPGTYGTATGLNCGGCLVFTWFPSVWAAGEQVMNADGTESLLASDTAKEHLQHLARPVEVRRRAAVARRTRPVRPGPPASPRARSALMPYPATLLLVDDRSTSASPASPASTAARRPSSAATASASRRTPRRPPRPGTS